MQSTRTDRTDDTHWKRIMKETKTTLNAAGHPLPQHWLAVIGAIWAGQAVSIVTSYAASFAVVWYITESTSSALLLSLASICAYLPIGLISPFGGVLADRHSRKAIMIISDGVVGLISLALGFAILAGSVNIPLLLLFTIARATGQAFHSPAMMATMPHLVPEKHLVRINTLDQTLASAASIGAPVFGIFLYTTLGFHAVMFLDFIGAAAAVAGLALAKIPVTHDETTKNQHVIANLMDGWHAFSSKRGLVILLLGITLAMVVFAPLGALYPLMTLEHFGGDGYMASIAEATWGIGMLVGSGILMAWGGGKKLVRLIIASCVIVGATTATCGFLPSSGFWAFAVLNAIMAMACAWLNGPCLTLVQKNIPEEKLGRAMGFIGALMGLTSPIGIAIGGPLADVIGIAPFFIVDGVTCMVIGALLYLPRSVRALDAPPAKQSKLPE